jgi:hypothetical protein
LRIKLLSQDTPGELTETLTYIDILRALTTYFLQQVNIKTYHTRFIPEGVAEVSQIFLRDTHVLSKLVSYGNTADVTGGKSIVELAFPLTLKNNNDDS